MYSYLHTPQKLFPFHAFTTLFNNMRTLKFKAQPTNAFFATVNQMFAGPSQLSTAAERAMIESLCRVHIRQRTEFLSSRKLGGPAEHLIDGSEKPIFQLSF